MFLSLRKIYDKHLLDLEDGSFSDGVIAVIITIMVLELKVPTTGAFAGMRAIAPTLAVYALSYTFVGIYWIDHHLLLDRIRENTSQILRANLVWLFFLSLLPFFTAYVLDKREDTFSVALYASSLLLTGLSFLGLRLTINARQHAENNFAREDRSMQRKHLISVAVYIIAIPIAFLLPVTALCLMASVNLLWIAPDFGLAQPHEKITQVDVPR